MGSCTAKKEAVILLMCNQKDEGEMRKKDTLAIDKEGAISALVMP